MGIVYDALTSATKLTQDSTMVTLGTFYNCLMNFQMIPEGGMIDLSSEQTSISAIAEKVRKQENKTKILGGETISSDITVSERIPAIPQLGREEEYVPSLEDRLRQFGMNTYVYYYFNQGKKVEITPDEFAIEEFYLDKTTNKRYTTDEVEIKYFVLDTEGNKVPMTYEEAYARREVLQKQFLEKVQANTNERQKKAASDVDYFKRIPKTSSLYTEFQDDIKRLQIKEELVIKPNALVVKSFTIDFRRYLKVQPRITVELERRISGKALFSALLPGDFYYNHEGVLITRGILRKGVITKKHIGAEHNSIIQALWKDYGMNRTVQFLTDAPILLNSWAEAEGPLTVGLKDCDVKDKSYEQDIQKGLKTAKLQIDALGTDEIKNPIQRQQREDKIIGFVGVAKNAAIKLTNEAQNLENNISTMVHSGAKGSGLNFIQITGLMGQQFVRGGTERIPLSITNQTRATPYFEQMTTDPRARGLVESSLLKGMTVAEMFYHAGGGREGLLDTATKTAETGAIHHRINKALENIIVASDGSVRDKGGAIFQFTYGEDGFSAAYLERVKTPSGREFASFININRIVGRINARSRNIPSLRQGFTEVQIAEKKQITTIAELDHEENDEKDRLFHMESTADVDND